MSLVRSIRSAVMRRMADAGARDRRRARAELARCKSGRPHEVLYFHQPDDPYSQLAAQALAPLLQRYDIVLKPRVVARPTPIAIHDQQLWDAWAQRDCGLIAPYYGLQWHGAMQPAENFLIDLARRILLAQEDLPGFPDIAVQVTSALQRDDRLALEALQQRQGAVIPADAERRLQSNEKLRHRLGHYLGGMFFYAGEWYWGIDRLHYLEARLDALGARRPAAPPGPSAALQRHAPDMIEAQQRITL
ncbi:MAG TPA: hypothetical protein VHE37_10855, partial [Nevskiaceae bacterium]|nr:hypothetical protein [Nevskiaceae bacterium]